MLSTAAYRAEDEAEGDPADAVVWDELVSRTREESSLTVTYLLFLCIACLIAAVGVSQTPRSPSSEPWWSARNSDRWRRWPSHSCGGACIWRAALLTGFPAAMAVTAVGTLAAEAIGWVDLNSTSELSEVDFIFQVGPFSFVVALLAGAAGMLSLVSAKSAALVGVFISVTTVPAAGFAVVAATVGDWGMAAQSAVQLAVNLIGITLAGVLVLWVYQRAHAR